MYFTKRISTPNQFGNSSYTTKPSQLFRLIQFNPMILVKCILGDPGAVSRGGKKAKRARKKIGRRKVKKESRSPWDSSLNRPVPKPFKILACDWAQKYFLCPIRVQLFSCYFRDFLFESVHRQTFCSPVRHLFTCSCRRVSLDRKVPLKREP